jgi:hypothetical protein
MKHFAAVVFSALYASIAANAAAQVVAGGLRAAPATVSLGAIGSISVANAGAALSAPVLSPALSLSAVPAAVSLSAPAAPPAAVPAAPPGALTAASAERRTATDSVVPAAARPNDAASLAALFDGLRARVPAGGHVDRDAQSALLKETGLSPLDFARTFDSLRSSGNLLDRDDGTHVFFDFTGDRDELFHWAVRALNSGDAALQFRAYFVAEGAALAAQDGGSRFSAPALRQILVLRDQASRWALGTALRAVLDGGAGGARERKAARSVLESLSGAARPADRREIETVKSLFKRLRRESAEDSDLAAAYATLPRFLDGPAFVPQPGS